VKELLKIHATLHYTDDRYNQYCVDQMPD